MATNPGWFSLKQMAMIEEEPEFGAQEEVLMGQGDLHIEGTDNVVQLMASC